MKRTIVVLCSGIAIGGCTSPEDQPPLVFGRTQTFGATISGTVPDQGAQLTLGYGDRNVAIVPTTTRSGEKIRGVIDGGFEDSLSVLGQFEATTEAEKVGASLGTFFSTGQAASKLADGFAAKMGYKDPSGGQVANGNGGNEGGTGGASTPPN